MTAVIGAVPLLLAVVLFLRTTPDTHQRRLEDIVRSEHAVERAGT